MIVLLLSCILLFVGEWLYTELVYTSWLRQDSRRIDTSIYTTEAQLRTAILNIVPIGSSEEDVKSFFFTNTSYPTRAKLVTSWEPLERENSNRVTLVVWQTNRGHIIRRATQGQWLINFYIDIKDANLKDVKVEFYGFSL